MTTAERPHRRVVVTGLGLCTSLGFEVETVWRGLLDGRSGVGPIRQFPAEHMPVRIGSEIAALPEGPRGDEARAEPNRTLQFAVWAARRAWQHAGFRTPPAPERGAVAVGAGVFPSMEDRLGDGKYDEELFDADGLSTARHLRAYREEPHLLSQQNLAAVGQVLAARFRLGGPAMVVQSACASATQAIGEALGLIRDHRADVVLTGGADSMMSMFCVAGFSLLGALSRHDDPATASRPFDARRDGFVLGEGAGMLVLESLDHAEARGARIWAELAGYGASNDAFRFTDIHPEAAGAVASMRRALRDADLETSDVGYINAHGTATPQNDHMETLAIHGAFGDHARRLAVSSTKSQLGHLICAAGGVEAVFTALALAHRVLPPTLNLVHPDPLCDLDYVPNEAREAHDLSVALSSSFGFGGQNGTLAFRRWEGAS